MKHKKVYIAKRIPRDPALHFVLNVNQSMTIDQIHALYTEKVFVDKNYTYNGPWILRPPLSENSFLDNKLPIDLKPIHIWNMVKSKIENSDVIIGIVGNKSYGTIAEVGYACNQKGKAVYVLPEKAINEDDLQDLWFLFQMARGTKLFWAENDIKNINEFSELGLYSIDEYENFLDSIIPNFMKK